MTFVCKRGLKRHPLPLLESYKFNILQMPPFFGRHREKATSLQHDLEQAEESRNTQRKERDSFLGQLTKALEQLEDAKDRVREQNYQLKQRADEYTQCSKARATAETIHCLCISRLQCIPIPDSEQCILWCWW